MMKYILNFMIFLFLAMSIGYANNINSRKEWKCTQPLKVSDDFGQDVQTITDEFVSFWDKFSNALLKNNTTVLGSLIDDKFYGYCSKFINFFSERGKMDLISKMDLSVDTVISKKRFLKEFRNSLNPVYLQLLEQYDIREDIKPKKPIRSLEDYQNRYRCMRVIGKNDYLVGISVQENKIFFSFVLRKNIDLYSNEIKSIDLVFDKINDMIKLCGIEFNYSGTDAS